METISKQKISLSEFSKQARRAYTWTSFDPEKRGARVITEFEGQLNADLKDMPDAEQGRYIENYKKYFSRWLSAQSRCASSAITGGSGFNVHQAEKANASEKKRYEEFTDWREKALNTIKKRQEVAKPEEQRIADAVNSLKQFADSCAIPNNLNNRVATFAVAGEVEIVYQIVEYVKCMPNRTLFTPRHSFFKLPEIAETHRQKKAEIATRENSEITFPGGRVVQNWAENRLQIIFDEKPSGEIIDLLKKNSFKWAPSKAAWQRQNTGNAVYALKTILPVLKNAN